MKYFLCNNDKKYIVKLVVLINLDLFLLCLNCQICVRAGLYNEEIKNI